MSSNAIIINARGLLILLALFCQGTLANSAEVFVRWTGRVIPVQIEQVSYNVTKFTYVTDSFGLFGDVGSILNDKQFTADLWFDDSLAYTRLVGPNYQYSALDFRNGEHGSPKGGAMTSVSMAGTSRLWDMGRGAGLTLSGAHGDGGLDTWVYGAVQNDHFVVLPSIRLSLGTKATDFLAQSKEQDYRLPIQYDISPSSDYALYGALTFTIGSINANGGWDPISSTIIPLIPESVSMSTEGTLPTGKEIDAPTVAVPEPATFALLTFGIVLLSAAIRSAPSARHL